MKTWKPHAAGEHAMITRRSCHMVERLFAESHSNEESKVKEDYAKLVEVDGALHEDAWRQLQWKREIGRYLEKIVQK